MTLILKRMEELSAFFAKKFGPLSLLCCLAVVIIIILDVNYGLIRNLPEKLPKSTGKFFGKLGLTLAEVAVAYYLLREAYVQIKKRKIAIPQIYDDVLRSLVNTTRSVHPFVGVLVICFILSHGYIMTFAWLATKGAGAIWSGGVAFVGLLAVGVLGWFIRLRQPAIFLRKYHRNLAFLFFGLYFLHKAIAD